MINFYEYSIQTRKGESNISCLLNFKTINTTFNKIPFITDTS